ncbi:microtubule-associated tumor suppressor candidate 2 isoform X2 [Suncus etruscus]|uniref:microtubule-associated tumor suppressor candidate 2 isoform X2 n=1 Tax=Suncus etruscus TaxID=109475 RepID=UPI00210F7390|nr:microtubule-associated tumor suppressor candidate 2 isoform X2 [Suncus etruscus]
MSIPDASKKCYTQFQDKRNGAKNDNENLLSLGDTNANQIMLDGSSHVKSDANNLTDETGNANSIEPHSRTLFNKEFPQHQCFGKGPFAGPTGLKDSTFAPTCQEHNEKHMVERSTDILQTSQSSQALSLSSWRNLMEGDSSEVLTKCNADIPQHLPKDKLAKTLDNEELRRRSLERSSCSAIVGDTLLSEYVGNLGHQLLPPPPLESLQALHPVPSEGDELQKIWPAFSLETDLHPADSNSEGKSVCKPKAPTSETKDTGTLEAQKEGACVSKVGNESTLGSAYPEPDLNSVWVLKESPSQPEAQIGLGKAESMLERKWVPSRVMKGLRPAQVECLEEEDMLLHERKMPNGAAHQEATARGMQSAPAHTVLPHLGTGKGRNESGKRVAQGTSEEETLQTSPKQNAAFLVAAADQPLSIITQSTAKKWSEIESSSITTSNGGVTSLSTNSADGTCLDVEEGGSENMAPISDPPVGTCKTGVSEPHDCLSNIIEAEENKDMVSSASQHQNFLETPAKTERTPERANPILVVPGPLHTEITVNVTPQPALASCSSQNFGMLGVDMGSPVVATFPTDSTQLLTTSMKVPEQNAHHGELPKPVSTHPEGTSSFSEGMENHQAERTDPKPIIMPKPKYVRPKIITYIRRNPQTVGQSDTSVGIVPVGLPYDSATCSMPFPKEEKPAGDDLKTSANLCEKLKPELQKPRVFGSGLMVSGIKPPGHHLSQISEKFLQEVTERPGKDEYCSPSYTRYEVPPTFYRSAMLLKPQLGLGAMSRLPSAKSRILISSQRSSTSAIHPPRPITSAASLYNSDSTDLKKSSCSNAVKANLPKSGLRPPGYSRLPTAKLAAFGFVRSSSVSSVSSTQSTDSMQPEQGRINRSTFGNEDQPSLKASLPSKDTPKGGSRLTPQASSNLTAPCRSLLPAPKSMSTSAGTKKEVQKDQDTNKAATSSPKRIMTASTKLQSPGYPKQRTTAPRNGFSPKPDLQAREAERQLVQRLKERCEQQARQLSLVKGELKKTIRGFEAFAVSTQHFFGKSESAVAKGKELSIELASIRDEVAFSSAKCEKLQKEKEELELRFEEEVRRLGWQQQAELQELEERLQLQFQAELARLGEEHGAQLLRIRGQHQRQVEDITGSHEAALLEMENNHTVTITILQDDHDHKVQELMSAHELEKKELEESFEKLRLSLQDQVDTLTFQSECLRDRARRFEEALRKNTEEQLEIALAPYQHLEEDMKSLKQVLEMKNQQIHQQEKRIIELEKLAEKNIILEEKIQVLQQQNEDLKARIDQNTVVTRQLSEENANLQEYVEKETQEKKRLSRTNEELLWKLQTGDPTSPIKLSPTSPVYRGSSSGPSSPARVSTTPR